MSPLKWMLAVAILLPDVQNLPFHAKKQKNDCYVVNINKPAAKLKCYGLPDRLVCEERYKQVCENVITSDSRVRCDKKIVSDTNEEVCETEILNQCHTIHKTVYEEQCKTVNKIQCHEVQSTYGSYGSYGTSSAASSPSSGSESTDGGKKGDGKKGGKGKKGRRKRGVLQAALLQTALNQRHPTTAPENPAPRAPAPQILPAASREVCYKVPEVTCEKVPIDKPETVCAEVEGETLCARTPKAREVQTCRNVVFPVPQVSCRHIPLKTCENRPNKECHSVRVIHRGVGHRHVRSKKAR